MSYYDPEELPIDVAATDPLDGDLIFGLDDKPDELRHKFNYEEPATPGRHRLEKDAATTRSQLDRLARDISPQVNGVGPRFQRFIARTQAAMQLGVNKQQMLDWFYGGKSEVDPFRIAAAGYSAEARWFATEDQPRQLDNSNSGRDFTPDFLRDEPTTEVEANEVSEPHIEPAPVDELGFDLDIEPADMNMNGDGGLHADMLPIVAMVNGDDRNYDWLVMADVVKPLSSGTPNVLQPEDEVDTNNGQQGKVVDVKPDGTFTVNMTGGTGNSQQVTYKPDALQSGEVKRKDKGSGSTTPALPAPTAKRKQATSQSDTVKARQEKRMPGE